MTDYNGLFGPGGVFSSSGNGIFASSGTVPTADNPNAIVPGYAADNYTPLAGGGSNTDLAKALQGLSKGFGDAQKQTGGGAPAGAPAPGTVPSGHPAAPVNLNALIQLLQKRQQGLFDSATAGVGQAQPQAAPRVMGLLGY